MNDILRDYQGFLALGFMFVLAIVHWNTPEKYLQPGSIVVLTALAVVMGFLCVNK